MNIFITNDDGIHARGIRQLIAIAREFGNVYVVAPDGPQSGKSHAITLSVPMRAKPLPEECPGLVQYACSGTPVDCVKLGLRELFKDVQMDLLLSGINHGSNAATNVLYSGTMGAAIEGIMEGVPAIGFSMATYDQQVDFAPCEDCIRLIIRQMIAHGKPGCCWNVNIPVGEVKGIKACVQAHATWDERILRREDPHGKPYYWLEGDFENDDPRTDTDSYYLDHGYVAVVPVTVDMTDRAALARMDGLFG
ncbi:MAG: 5'/3'-nucleotidase SurE [Bacteroidales bacterium]|nr:5'/3'-nucleotidase SurE [Bacteroidales bacterium]MDE5735709.1 5'/3'-nucleotidase SurE [Bacteroidales bacterium]